MEEWGSELGCSQAKCMVYIGFCRKGKSLEGCETVETDKSRSKWAPLDRIAARMVGIVPLVTRSSQASNISAG